jgi:hypothetical protein
MRFKAEPFLIGAAVVVQRDHNLDRPFGDLVFAWVAQKGAG